MFEKLSFHFFLLTTIPSYYLSVIMNKVFMFDAWLLETCKNSFIFHICKTLTYWYVFYMIYCQYTFLCHFYIHTSRFINEIICELSLRYYLYYK